MTKTDETLDKSLRLFYQTDLVNLVEGAWLCKASEGIPGGYKTILFDYLPTNLLQKNLLQQC